MWNRREQRWGITGPVLNQSLNAVDQWTARGYVEQMPPSLSELEILGLTPFGKAGPGARFFALRLRRPDWPAWQPGQFVMLRPSSFGLELPWGRPFSICHLTQRHLIIFFQVVGEGTKRISQLKPGEKLAVWGPLGVGFAMEKDKPALLLAGGMGIAPFIGYINNHPQPWNLFMLFGHREPLECYPIDNVNELIQLESMADAKPGDLENFLGLMKEKIGETAQQSGIALACGPLPFLRAAKELCARAGLPLQISLEKRMACGIGACLGCAVKTTDLWPIASQANAPVQTCLHGPVFWADQIDI